MKRTGVCSAALAMTMLAGCATDMKVTGSACSGGECAGFPLRMPVTVLVTETTHFVPGPGKESDPAIRALCAQTESRQLFESLPLGELYYVNYEGGWLAKTEFTAEFHPSGVLKTVSVNGDPTQVVESTAGLIEAALPIAFPDRVADVQATDAQPAASGERDLAAQRKEHCLVASKTRSVRRLTIEG